MLTAFKSSLTVGRFEHSSVYSPWVRVVQVGYPYRGEMATQIWLAVRTDPPSLQGPLPVHVEPPWCPQWHRSSSALPWICHNQGDLGISVGWLTVQIGQRFCTVLYKYSISIKQEVRDLGFQTHFIAEATFVQSKRIQRLWKPSKPCNVGIHGIAHAEYSKIHEYPCARVAVITKVFCIILYWPN